MEVVSQGNTALSLITTLQRKQISTLFREGRELEFRFRNYGDELNYKHYLRVIQNYSQYPYNDEYSEVYSLGDIRQIVIIDENGESISTVWERKREIYADISKEYPWKISISTEEILSADEAKRNLSGPLPENPNRIRNRRSFSLGNYRLDCSEVIVGEHTRYEIELEVLKIDSMDSLARIVEEIACVLLDTNILYTVRERNSLVDFYNRTLLSNYRPNYKRQPNLSDLPLVKPRSLTMFDLSTQKTLINNNGEGTYSLTLKTDGLRKIMVIDQVGLWLVSPISELNLVIRSNIAYAVGLIVDGELIPKESRTTPDIQSKYMYQIYDGLATHPEGESGTYASTAIQKRPHSKRMADVQIIIENLRDFVDDSLISIATKQFFGYANIDEFFQKCEMLLLRQATSSYLTDGLIMVPENDPYMTKNVLKWKPLDKLTIDFAIRETEDGYELYSGSTETEDNLVQFTDNRYPNAGKIQKYEALAGYPTNSVYEFSWDYDSDTFVPYRSREDKDYPNSMNVARNVFSTIIDRIDEDVITGRSNKLLRRYHNNIKRELLQLTPNTRGENTLLDLGSGRGGDVNKWNSYSKIVAVEPDEDNLKELQRRIESSNMTNRVRVVQAKAQDTDKIYREVIDFLGDRASAVSIFNSLNLINENPETLQHAMDTVTRCLKDNGMIHVMFLDAKSLLETLRPSMNTAPEISVLDLKIATISLEGDNKVRFTFPGTIINPEGQNEYQVRKDDLISILQPRGFTYKFYIADKNLLLSSNERALSSLYTYGTFTWSQKSGVAVPARSEIRVVKSIRSPVKQSLNIRRVVPSIPPASEEIVGQLPLVKTEGVDSPTGPVFQSTTRIPAPDAGSIVINSPSDEELIERAVPKVSPLPIGRRLQAIAKPQRDVVRSIGFIDTPGNTQNLDLAESITYDDIIIYHIATISDTSPIIHAILKATYPPYSSTKQYIQRHNMVMDIRREIASKIINKQVSDIYNSVETIKEQDLIHIANILRITIWLVDLTPDELKIRNRIGNGNHHVVLYVNDNLTRAEPIGIKQGVDTLRVKFTSLDNFLTYLNQKYQS